jgi:surfactin synthase thioesterase subunit
MSQSDRSVWWSRPGGGSDQRLQLFCFPFAGGGASIFRLWQEELSPDVEVIGVQLPGREARFHERPFTEMAPLMAQLALAIRPCFERPVALFGHSAGAMIAFELARTLQVKWGLALQHLIVTGCNPPHLQSPLNYSLHHLDDDAFIAALRRLNGIPTAIMENVEFLKLYLPVMRADIQLAESYTHTVRERLNCPITALRGKDDSHTSPEAIEHWRELGSGKLSLDVVPGDHFFPLTNRGELLAAIGKALHSGPSP